MTVDYVGLVRLLGWKELRRLWEQIETGAVAGWPPGRALEHLVLRAFELSGATVRWPYRVAFEGEVVEQIDGAVHLHGLSCIVECKDTGEPTRIEAIAKLRNQLLRRPAGAVGLLFSRSGFTEPALLLTGVVAPQTILLWDGDEIAYLLDRGDFAPALLEKYRRSVETGLPIFDIRQEVA